MRCQKWFCLLIGMLFCVPLSYAELRDPTRPDGYVENPEASANSLVVNAIIISEQRRVAVINGQPVQEGDLVAGVRVIGIHENSVELEGADNKMTLYLISTSVKHPVKK